MGSFQETVHSSATSSGRSRTWGGYADLTLQLVRREISQKYRGATLGAIWPIVHPLLLLAVYTFVFSVVFRARWPEFSEGGATFPLAVFCGLITFGLFAEPVAAAPRLLLGYRDFVTRVPFPIELLPVVKVLAALFQAAIGLGVLIVGALLFGSGVSPAVIWIPVVWLPVACFALGFTYLIAAFGVFVRDLDQLIGFFLTALLFGSAIFYPLAQVPGPARELLAWLPTAAFVESARALLFQGTWAWDFRHTALAIASVGSILLGLLVFRSGRSTFADVL